MTSLTLSYALSLPAEPLPMTPSAASHDSFTAQLDPSTARAHLETLELAIGHARDWLNHNLTDWKTALKDVEREPKPSKADDDDDQEED